MIRTIIIITAAAMILGGCTLTPLAKPSSQPDTEQKTMILPEARETPPMVVPEKTEPPAEQDYQHFGVDYQPGESDEPQGKQRGFRVQVIMTEDPARADDLIQEIETEMDLPVYRIFEPPYYKVRVGNCVDRSEAEELMEELRREGYETFIVRDMVNPADNEQ